MKGSNGGADKTSGCAVDVTVGKGGRSPAWAPAALAIMPTSKAAVTQVLERRMVFAQMEDIIISRLAEIDRKLRSRQQVCAICHFIGKAEKA